MGEGTKAIDKTNNEDMDYKELYFNAMNKLTDIFFAVERAQQELEELYLRQTELDENLKNPTNETSENFI